VFVPSGDPRRDVGIMADYRDFVFDLPLFVTGPALIVLL